MFHLSQLAFYVTFSATSWEKFLMWSSESLICSLGESMLLFLPSIFIYKYIYIYKTQLYIIYITYIYIISHLLFQVCFYSFSTVFFLMNPFSLFIVIISSIALSLSFLISSPSLLENNSFIAITKNHSNFINAVRYWRKNRRNLKGKKRDILFQAKLSLKYIGNR